jgi:hypothetical protein
VIRVPAHQLQFTGVMIRTVVRHLAFLLLPLALLACDPEPQPEACPETPPTDGAACDLQDATLTCGGAQDVTSCEGSYGGQRDCHCVDGTWSCPNIFCADFCPNTADEAQAAPACDATSGACYYEETVCSCANGHVTCS